MEKIYDHENEAADIIARQPRILLFDSMGMGKTVSTLLGLKKVIKGSVGPIKCVVCAPNTLLSQWADEVSKWLSECVCIVGIGSKNERSLKYEYFNDLKFNAFLLTNYNYIVKDSFFKETLPDVLIIDEGYVLRNKNNRLFKFISSISQHSFKKLIILSGNISAFTDAQFYDLVDLIFPGEVLASSKAVMIEALGEKFISRDFGTVFGTEILKPDIRFIPCKLNSDQQTLLSGITLEINSALRLKKHNIRPLYRRKQFILSSPRILDPSLSLSPKEEFLINIIPVITGKCVIYCSDIKFYSLLQSDLNSIDASYVTVSGEMSLDKRSRNLNIFNSDPAVKFLLLSGVGKLGLNLQTASTLICMSLLKGNLELDQLVGRLYRINQHSKVVCYIPYHPNWEYTDVFV